MFFSRPIVELPKITAPTASEICARSNPSSEAKALLTPTMTPPQYLNTLEKNKLSVDSVNFLAHGLPEKDGICWAAQGCRLVTPKLSAPELDALKATEGWLRNQTPDLRNSVNASLGKVDFTGPASWAAQAAMWSGAPSVPGISLVAAAVVGAILIAMGLSIGTAMPAIPKPRLQVPMMPLSPEMFLQLQKPQLAMNIPALDQPKMMKPLLPFIDLGKGVALGNVKCC
jgi:hypothetical protein